MSLSEKGKGNCCGGESSGCGCGGVSRDVRSLEAEMWRLVRRWEAERAEREKRKTWTKGREGVWQRRRGSTLVEEGRGKKADDERRRWTAVDGGGSRTKGNGG
nr:hypothetical protein Iba_chr06aCG8240 [Ipomoea batatas]GMD04385.1 hypothetical protein Iba_scaffold39102CG0010 [Ipomoea batatas]GMD92120.1 hypothetical protein Iba_scaffold54136CG0010 [Ipomoea batatas]GME16365.1 hypothetical protein Iba_scaffold17460CG0010 [Ipomoea batatas]